MIFPRFRVQQIITAVPSTKVTLLSQILRLIPRDLVQDQVNTHQTDKHAKGFDTWSHLASMLLCHLGKLSSLREVAGGMRSATGNLVHLGVDKPPKKSNLSYQNKQRDWKVFRDVYLHLLECLEPSLRKRKRYAARLKRKIFLIDSTTIPLALSLFDWAHFRRRKGGVKLHTVLDYDTSLPVFINLTEARTHDSNGIDDFVAPRGSVIVADRAYLDFTWLKDLDSSGVFFVLRLRSNVQWESVAEHYDNMLEGEECDCSIKLTGDVAAKKYPKQLRLVRIYDEVNEQWITVITNNTSWTAETVTNLYRGRWEIETFFKTIKQTLKIKTFLGTSENAVLIQVWTAMIAILLVRYLKNKAKHAWHLSNLVGFLRLNLFVKIDLWDWVNNPMKKRVKILTKQPLLFGG